MADVPSRGLSRLLPIVGWLPRYDRSMLRGDVLARARGDGDDRPEGPRLRGHRGRAGAERALRGGGRRDRLRAVLHVAAHLDGAELVAGDGRGRSRAVHRAWAAAGAAELVAAITLVTGALFLLLALLRAGVDRAVPLPRRRDRLPRGSRGRRRRRRAAEADRHVELRRQRLAGARPRGSAALGDISWTTLLVGLLALGADPRPALLRAARARAPSCSSSRACSPRGCSTSARTASRSWGTCPAACRRRRCREPTSSSEHYATILAAAAGLLLIGFSQTAGDARAFAVRHRYRIDVNQESVAQGMANVASGVFQGMPVSTSLSASSLNEAAGARSPMASLATGGFVILTLVALAPLFSDLPKAVLAAIIIDAVVFGMIDVPELRRLYRVKRFDFWIAAAAVLGVLSAGVLAGVVIGIALSLVWLVYVATAPGMPLLGREPGTQVFRDLVENPGDETFPGIVVVRLDGGLFFATGRRARGADPRARRREATPRTPSCSTSRAWTSSTPREPRSSRRSSSTPRASRSSCGSPASSPTVAARAREGRRPRPPRPRPRSTATSTAPSRRSSPPTARRRQGA